MQIQNKTIAITGAGRGIGRAIALSFARRGANLALLDFDATTVDETRALCEETGIAAHALKADVTSEAEVEAAMKEVVARFGRFDVVVNNAGILKDALLVKVKDGEVTGKMTLGQWQSVIDVNLTGVFLCAREAAHRMIELGNGGVILNISSVSRAGNAGQTNYSAAKAGVVAMTVVWAKELARFGIRVGAIAPGFTRTGILDGMRPQMLEKVIAPVPLKRLGTVEEIAHAAAFAVENDFFTGRCIDLDGGLRL